MNRRITTSTALLTLSAFALSGCADSAEEPAAAASSATNAAMAGPDTAVPTESAQERADRHNAMQDATEQAVDEDGNPIAANPNQPTMEEMERAVAEAKEAEANR